MKGNILLITDNCNFKKDVEKYFFNSCSYNLITTTDEIDIFAKLVIKPEILIIDTANVLLQEKVINAVPDRTVIIMLTDSSCRKAKPYFKVDYYLTKNVSADIIGKLISKISYKVYPLKQYSVVDNRLSNIFIMLGIPVNTIGYRMLKDAVKLVISDPLITTAITKNLYPVIAKDYNISTKKVERDIRHSITVAYNKGTIYNIEHLFGMPIFLPNEKPTNSEFISIIAEKLRLEGFIF